jgi:hypothetical protein
MECKDQVVRRRSEDMEEMTERANYCTKSAALLN